MNTQVDEEQPDLVHEVQDLARLHVDLARAEVRDGTRRLQTGIAWLMLAFASTCLLVLAVTVTVYLLLQTRLPPWAAAAVTTAALGTFAALAVRLGRWQLKGTRALLLPRTRALLGELFSWRNEKSNGS